MVDFVRCVSGAVEHIVAAEKEHAGTMLFSGPRDIHRSMAVHVECQLAIALTTIDIGVCSCEYDPIGAGKVGSIPCLLRVAEIRILWGETDKFICRPPFPHGPSPQP